MVSVFTSPVRNQKTALLWLSLAAAVLLAAWKTVPLLMNTKSPPSSEQSADSAELPASPDAASPDAEGSGDIEFPEESWAAAGLEMRAVQSGSFVENIELTGKVTLNEDNVTHIFPLVDGRVDEVKVRFGQKVKKGDLLLVVQSREVGQAMLKLSQNRLQLQFAINRDQWIQSVAENTKVMLDLIRKGTDIEDIEKQLKDRPLGEYRNRLMTAYIENYRSEKHLTRLSPLSKDGVVAGKQLLEAESEWKAAKATLQSLVEQIQQDSQQAAIISSQTVRELQTSVSVDETTLKILGFEDRDLVNVDPEVQGETIAHYPITAPFDGTVISKDAVLYERVGPERQIMSIADLSTVWVTTDIYEEHLPLLKQLEGQTIYLQSNAWPGQRFEATIFYTGDVVNESSRTVSMRATSNNADGFLKPGMFVTVEFPSVSLNDVLHVPDAAVMDHEGRSFVFVHRQGGKFERRDVTPGRRNTTDIEILNGVKEGDMVVTNGGFAIKSRMLSDLLSE